MERIVHGHYADPDSTRDIIGITPKEFEIIISALQLFYNSWEQLLALSKSDRSEFFEACKKAGFVNNEAATAEGVEEFLSSAEDDIVKSYNTAYEILRDINQPYPGANYNKI